MAVLALFSTAMQADDAFHGILPVTDAKMTRSLNGEWALKVIERTAGLDAGAPVGASSVNILGHIALTAI